MKNSSLLKTLAIAITLGGASLFTAGCSHSGLEYDFLAPPAYTSSENSARIWRYAAFDWNQAIEDFDRNVTMTRAGSRMTLWDIRHSD